MQLGKLSIFLWWGLRAGEFSLQKLNILLEKLSCSVEQSDFSNFFYYYLNENILHAGAKSDF